MAELPIMQKKKIIKIYKIVWNIKKNLKIGDVCFIINEFD